MRSTGLRSMYRPVRTVAVHQRIRWTRWLELCIAFAVSLVLLSRVKSEYVSNPKRIIQKNLNNQSNKENLSNIRNSTSLSVRNNNDFYIGYSGYLYNSSLFEVQDVQSGYIDPLAENDRENKVNGHQRNKRGVSHLYNMIVCATGCNPLSYKGYGCYCGFLGSGYPMDGIDRCCKMHDWCYNIAECPMFVEYFVPYYWKCYHGYKPVCAIDHGEWGSSGSCAQRLCECDKAFAECLRMYRCPRHKAVCTSSPWRLIQNLFMII